MAKLLRGIGIAGLTIALAAGCGDWMAEQTKKDPNSIIGKTTQNVEKFDPKAKQEVSDSKVHVDPSPVYALQAYRPMVEQITKAQVKHSIDLFEASEGRYPKDYDEFMTRIIKPGIHLPVLPGGWKYAYDVENHELQVVKADGEAKK